MAFDTAALAAGALMGLPGIIFMVKNKHTVSNAMTEAGFTGENSDMFALACYYLYLVGMVLWALSCLMIGLTIELPAALSACAAVAGPITILFWMAINKTSITGIPGIMGPPLPARVVLMVIGITLHVNAIMHGVDGSDSSSAWIKFFALYFASLAVPHLIGFKHRKDGWKTMV